MLTHICVWQWSVVMKSIYLSTRRHEIYLSFYMTSCCASRPLRASRSWMRCPGSLDMAWISLSSWNKNKVKVKVKVEGQSQSQGSKSRVKVKGQSQGSKSKSRTRIKVKVKNKVMVKSQGQNILLLDINKYFYNNTFLTK